jgi:hypothetical protein
MVQEHAEAHARLEPNCMVLGSAPWEKPAQSTVFDALLAETPMIFFYDSLKAGEFYDFRHAWTLNLSVRAKDFAAAGGFFEQLRPVYYEDVAFGYQMLGFRRKGILYHPDAQVIHRHPMTVDQYLDREELLGIMAPVLARVCHSAFMCLFKNAHIHVLAEEFDQWCTLDHASHRFVYQRFKEWAELPESVLPQDPIARRRLLMTIYQMHIPLKRLTFRLGFGRGMHLIDDHNWMERSPRSDWLPIVRG